MGRGSCGVSERGLAQARAEVGPGAAWAVAAALAVPAWSVRMRRGGDGAAGGCSAVVGQVCRGCEVSRSRGSWRVARRLVRRLRGVSGGKWWAMTGSNRRHSRCKRDALPTELIAPAGISRASRRFREPVKRTFAERKSNGKNETALRVPNYSRSHDRPRQGCGGICSASGRWVVGNRSQASAAYVRSAHIAATLLLCRGRYREKCNIRNIGGNPPFSTQPLVQQTCNQISF